MRKGQANRKTTPKVKDGVVQKKNRHAPTRSNSLEVGFQKPYQGYHHVITRDDVWLFIRLIPDWKRVSTDLDHIYLQAGDYECDGWYAYPAIPQIAICAWDGSLEREMSWGYYEDHKEVFLRLGVPVDESGKFPVAKFTEESARAYQLLHILLHELGHHHYRITKGRGRDGGSEDYAERYAIKMEKLIWKRFKEAFKYNPEHQK